VCDVSGAARQLGVLWLGSRRGGSARGTAARRLSTAPSRGARSVRGDSARLRGATRQLGSAAWRLGARRRVVATLSGAARVWWLVGCAGSQRGGSARGGAARRLLAAGFGGAARRLGAVVALAALA